MILGDLYQQAALHTLSRLEAKEREDAAWYAKLLQRASKETTNFAEAMLIAEAAFSMQPREIRLSWERFAGPKGGVGWKSNKTGEIRYQQEQPGEREEGQPEGGGQQASQQPDIGQEKSKIDEWGKREFAAWAERLSEQEKFAIQAYSSGGYEQINEYLWQGGDLNKAPGKMKQVVEDLDVALRRGQAPQDMKAYRGIRGEFADQMIKLAQQKGEYASAAFVSSTLSREQANEYAKRKGEVNAIIEIDVPKGSPGAYTDVLDITGETEWLMPLHTPLQFESAEQLPDGKWKLKAKVKQTEKPSRESSVAKAMGSAAFSFDIFNKKAQGILNRALKASAEISDAAKKELRRIASNQNRSQMAMEVVQFVAKYRMQLTKLLGATNLASLLEGASEVARRMPPLPPLGGQAPPPPTLPLEEAEKLVRELKRLKPHEQEEAIYRLPPDQQGFVRGAIQSGTPPPSHPLRITPPSSEEPEYTQYPIIEQAAKLLGERNLVNSWTFHRLDDAARSKAFTVTGVDAQVTLGKIRDAIVQNIQEGADFETFRENIVQSVEEGTFLSDAHMEVVFRTNIQTAFSDGQMAVLSHPFIRSGFPYASYEAIHDDRTRPDHLALEKLGIEGTNVYRIDDPVFQLFRPAWDFNCRCSWIAMTIRQAAEKGVTEAQRWLETGEQPYPPAYVDMPPFQPPASFQRAVSAMPLSIQMSLDIPLGQQLREEDNPKPDKKIDWELWNEIKALIPAEWMVIQKQAVEFMKDKGFPTEFPYEIGKLGDIKVTIIDGLKLLVEHDMDFTQGGNGEEDHGLCGKKEIVLDSQIGLPNIGDYYYILYHEENERRLMAKGMDYEKAHENSNRKEKWLRLHEPVDMKEPDCPTCGGKTKTDGESRWCQSGTCEWTSTL